MRNKSFIMRQKKTVERIYKAHGGYSLRSMRLCFGKSPDD